MNRSYVKHEGVMTLYTHSTSLGSAVAEEEEEKVAKVEEVMEEEMEDEMEEEMEEEEEEEEVARSLPLSLSLPLCVQYTDVDDSLPPPPPKSSSSRAEEIEESAVCAPIVWEQPRTPQEMAGKQMDSMMGHVMVAMVYVWTCVHACVQMIRGENAFGCG